MINKIMINGYCCSGKDEIGGYLCEEYKFNKIFFAQGIYEIAYKYLGMKDKKREWLQDIGQKMREIKPTVWLDYTYNQVNENEKYCITDVRQANEYLQGIKHGFLPIRVSADLDIRIERSIERDGSYPDIDRWTLPGETGADPFDYIEVNNNGSLEELYQQIDNIMKRDYTDFINYLQGYYKKHYKKKYK